MSPLCVQTRGTATFFQPVLRSEKVSVLEHLGFPNSKSDAREAFARRKLRKSDNGIHILSYENQHYDKRLS